MLLLLADCLYRHTSTSGQSKRSTRTCSHNDVTVDNKKQKGQLHQQWPSLTQKVNKRLQQDVRLGFCSPSCIDYHVALNRIRPPAVYCIYITLSLIDLGRFKSSRHYNVSFKEFR